jgi:hypothetical protein
MSLQNAKLGREKPARVTAMSSAQTSTNSYVTVDETVLEAGDKNRLDFFVEETGGSNGITVKIVGRLLDNGDNACAWQDVSGEVAISASGSAILTVTDPEFEEYALQIKSTSGGSHGDAMVYGGFRLVQHRAGVEEAPLIATRTINAESSDDITVNYQLSSLDTKLVHITGYKGAQTSAGDLEEETDAALTMSDGTNGTTLQGDDTHAALFKTTTTGALDVIYTDAGGASSKEFILVLREGGPTGRVIDIHVVSFDGA